MLETGENARFGRIEQFERKIGKLIINFTDSEYKELIKSFECKKESYLNTVLANCREYLKYVSSDKKMCVNMEKHPDRTLRKYIMNNKSEFIFESEIYITRKRFMDFINDKRIFNYRDKQILKTEFPE